MPPPSTRTSAAPTAIVDGSDFFAVAFEPLLSGVAATSLAETQSRAEPVPHVSSMPSREGVLIVRLEDRVGVMGFGDALMGDLATRFGDPFGGMIVLSRCALGACAGLLSETYGSARREPHAGREESRSVRGRGRFWGAPSLADGGPNLQRDEISAVHFLLYNTTCYPP